MLACAILLFTSVLLLLAHAETIHRLALTRTRQSSEWGEQRLVERGVQLSQLRRRSSPPSFSPLKSFAYYIYAADFTIGGTPYSLCLDTGSAFLAVQTSQIAGASPAYTSFSKCDWGVTLSFSYLLGKWTGSLCTDAVEFAGISAPTINFIGMKSESYLTFPAFNQGLAGLSFPTYFTDYSKTPLPFLDQFKSSGAIDSTIFALQLCRQTNAGYISIGGYESQFFNGTIQWLNLNRDFFYNVTMVRLEIAGGPSLMGPRGCVVDSGTNSILVPQAQYQFVADRVARLLPNPGVWCATEALYGQMPDLRFEFTDAAGAPFVAAITSENYLYLYQSPVCPAGLQALELKVHPSDMILLGTPFFAQFYSIFDQENMRVGFAPIAGCNTTFEYVNPIHTPPPTSKKSLADNPAAIGGIVVLLLVIVIGLAICCFVMYRKNYHKSEISRPMHMMTLPAQGPESYENF